jgi:copper resistance protein C
MPLGELQENLHLRQSLPLIVCLALMMEGKRMLERTARRHLSDLDTISSLRQSHRTRRADVRPTAMGSIFAVLVSLIALVAPMTAQAHAHLDHASPGAGSTVTAAPTEVVLSFTEKLEPKFSTIEVYDAKDTAVQASKATIDPASPAQLRVALKPLPPGTYKVIWHVLSVDTHRTNGSFTFRVGP